MRVLVFGARGLLGRALCDVFSNEEVIPIDRQDLDIADAAAVRDVFERSRPELAVNAAAYNAVDRAEEDVEASREAHTVNGEAVARLAREAHRAGARFVHFSTDYVFDGEKGAPYVEEDVPNPVSNYGRSKLAGERAVLEAGERGLAFYLIRTSRLFGSRMEDAHGKPTFVELVVGRAKGGEPLRFIDDEIASPTYAVDLAAATKDLVMNGVSSGIYHRTNDGAASWYDFARAVVEGVKPLLDPAIVDLQPITSSSLLRPARRPKYSVLQSTALPPLRHWCEALKEHLSIFKLL